MFISRISSLDIELNTSVRPAFTLSPSTSPITSRTSPISRTSRPSPTTPPLLPPNALQTLHTLTTTTTGTALGFLYQDLLDEATYYLSQLYHHGPHPPPPPVPSSEIVEWRQERTARCNRATSRFPSAPPVTPDADDAPAAEDGAEGEPIEASAAAGETMATLFSKTGGGLTWTAFCAAMEELGFTKEDKVGAVVEFYPPPGLAEEGKGGGLWC